MRSHLLIPASRQHCVVHARPSTSSDGDIPVRGNKSSNALETYRVLQGAEILDINWAPWITLGQTALRDKDRPTIRRCRIDHTG